MNTVTAIIRVSRPKQWIKNVVVLFGLLFSGSFMELQNMSSALLAFASFVFVSSAVYINNDIKDREQDRHHPEKRKRPIASGELSVKTALLFSVAFTCIGFYLGSLINLNFSAALLVYFLINVGYSLFLKNFIIVDVFVISSGYVLRIIAGVLAVNILPTIWFVISIMFASLFIGFAKRRGELTNLGADASNHRKNLGSYNIEFLNAMIFINVAIAIATYLLFVIFLSEEHPLMIITVPFIAFAAYRYIFLVFNSDIADSPETIFLDKPLLINNVIWIILFVLTKLDYFGKDYQLFKLVE